MTESSTVSVSEQSFQIAQHNSPRSANHHFYTSGRSQTGHILKHPTLSGTDPRASCAGQQERSGRISQTGTTSRMMTLTRMRDQGHTSISHFGDSTSRGHRLTMTEIKVYSLSKLGHLTRPSFSKGLFKASVPQLAARVSLNDSQVYVYIYAAYIKAFALVPLMLTCSES